MSSNRETFNIYVEGVPHCGKTEVARCLASMNGLNAYAESFHTVEPQWEVLLSKGETRSENAGSKMSSIVDAFNDHVFNAAYEIHASATTKKIKICSGSVLIAASIFAPFLGDCGRLNGDEVKMLQARASRYLQRGLCDVHVWIYLYEDSHITSNRLEQSSAVASSPFTREQLDKLKQRYDDYFLSADFFEGDDWVKKNRPIFNTGNSWLYTFRHPYLITIDTGTMRGDWSRIAALIREKIARSDGIPSRYREVPHPRRDGYVWDFWWNEDENEDDDYPNWLIPLLPFRRLYTFKMFRKPLSERVVDNSLINFN
jgi:hypothetical protein